MRKLTRERRFLMSKLDEFGDDYRSAQLPIPIEVSKEWLNNTPVWDVPDLYF